MTAGRTDGEERLKRGEIEWENYCTTKSCRRNESRSRTVRYSNFTCDVKWEIWLGRLIGWLVDVTLPAAKRLAIAFARLSTRCVVEQLHSGLHCRNN